MPTDLMDPDELACWLTEKISVPAHIATWYAHGATNPETNASQAKEARRIAAAQRLGVDPRYFELDEPEEI